MTTKSRSPSGLGGLADATRGFDAVFNDDVEQGKQILTSGSTPFHLLGLGITTFLQAALGMEDGLMADAAKALSAAETSSKSAQKTASLSPHSRFRSGMEWEVLQADTVLLLGLTQALNETYMGYVQCLYSLNSSHSRFTKLYKAVFPNGLSSYPTPATPVVSRKPSSANLSVVDSSARSVSSVSIRSTGKGGLFSRWSNSGSSSPALSGTTTPVTIYPEGEIESLVVYGTAFGYGLFNLVFSLLPAKIKRLVGFLGYQSDRALALQALAVSAAGRDPHSTFAALVLMTYQGVILLLSGYQFDEDHLLKQIEAMLDSLEPRFPHGSLWLLNRAKLSRYQNNPTAAISILQAGLAPEKPIKFVQADALLVFELAWVLLAERRYEESADAFLRMTKINAWSHPTYTYLAAGCYLALNNQEATAKAQALLATLPTLLQKKKVGGRDLPTEVFIIKKLDFWRRKQTRWFGAEKEDAFVQCIRINPAEELGVFWNNHGRISKTTAEAHIHELLTLTPAVDIATPYAAELASANSTPTKSPHRHPSEDDLDTQDEISLRYLILGVAHRSAGEYTTSRSFLQAAATRKTQELEGKWMVPLAYFELAVLEMQETKSWERKGVVPQGTMREKWTKAIKMASEYLDKSAGNLGDTDLSSRLDARIPMLRDELELKKKALQQASEA